MSGDRFDVAVIGGGSGGLSVAAAAAQFGQKVVLFEKSEMGGECLNTGCVPSKALIAAAHAAHAVRDGQRFGVHAACAAAFTVFALPALSLPVQVATAFLIVWAINLYNFMDGSDGLAGGMAVFGFGTFAAAFAIAGDGALAPGVAAGRGAEEDRRQDQVLRHVSLASRGQLVPFFTYRRRVPAVA